MVSFLCVACKEEIKAIAYDDVNRFKQCPFCGAVIVRTTFVSIEPKEEQFDTAESVVRNLEKASALLRGDHDQ